MSIKAFLLVSALLSATAPAAAAAQDWGFGFQGRGRGQGRGDSLGAGWRPQQDEARDRVRGGEIMPLARVLGAISRRTPGRHLDVGLEDAGGRPVYRVRWAAEDGRRIDYLVDARSGAVLRADGE
jgi:uncharacterized membrane protein YkoI